MVINMILFFNYFFAIVTGEYEKFFLLDHRYILGIYLLIGLGSSFYAIFRLTCQKHNKKSSIFLLIISLLVVAYPILFAYQLTR